MVDAARRPWAKLESILVDRLAADIAPSVRALGELDLGAEHGIEGGVERLRGRGVSKLLDCLGRPLADPLAEPDRCAVGGRRRQPLDGASEIGFLLIELGLYLGEVEIRHRTIMPPAEKPNV